MYEGRYAYCSVIVDKQACKLQDAQAEKLTSLQANKLTSWLIDKLKIYKLSDWQMKRRFDDKIKTMTWWNGNN